jgi:hypothetical protein
VLSSAEACHAIPVLSSTLHILNSRSISLNDIEDVRAHVSIAIHVVRYHCMCKLASAMVMVNGKNGQHTHKTN